jgi:murein DD-endopeptidase MepM/ murein hydrolase activator NlpD
MADTSLINPANQVPVDLLTSSGSRLGNRLAALQGASGSKQKAELKNVSEKFEAIFIAHMLKVMRDTIEDSGLLDGGFGKSIYTDLFDQEVSLKFAQRGTLGISNLLYKNLSNKLNDADEKETGNVPATGKAAPSVAAPRPSTNKVGSEEEISDFQLPVQAPISSAFGMRRDPFSHQAKFHKGLDLAAPEGMKVVPALQGKVVYAGYMSGYGDTVVVQHSGELQTRYGHLGSIAVRVGDAVDSQSTLGTVGSTGRSTGAHLHFEVIRNGKAVDPMENLNVSSSGSRTQSPQKGV